MTYPIIIYILLYNLLTFFSNAAIIGQEPAPDEHRFKKVVLAKNLSDPFELDIAYDGRVFFIEKEGYLKVYDPAGKKVKVIRKLNVFTGWDDGLIGLALDPDFKKTNWIYLLYSPVGPESVQQVARFTLENDSLSLASEKRLLKYPVERDHCCHSAGSMAFDGLGNLYISTGDNSGAVNAARLYAPIDERKGQEVNDAQRTSGNTKDLRGKILRIHPEPNGTYTIPAGNLFPDGKEGKPEIYVMGCRNPFRIDIDPKTNYLYWGDVGADADCDSTHGPRGYDEINQARKAGNYGWPYFTGNNKAYSQVDFATGKAGAAFNPTQVVNNSPNNTGAKILPPAQKAFIWYPYDQSPDFSSLGTGGRTAITGPVYHYNPKLASSVKFPAYFDNTLFIGEWMRNWIKTVKLSPGSDLVNIKDFMPHAIFKKPTDMKFGPDGALYLIEYGSSWFTNADAQLVKIEYISGNRAPIAKGQADKLYGGVPLTVAFSGAPSLDYDQDQLQYEWRLAGKVLSRNKNFRYTFQQPGKQLVTLQVTDTKGARSRHQLEINAGNSMPLVEIQVPNKTFYSDTLQYRVMVQDAEDGSLEKGTIGASTVNVTLTYLPPEKTARSSPNLGQRGDLLVAENDCKGCHQVKEKSVGPSFIAVANRYQADAATIGRLADKIVQGGNGGWGETAMSAHPQLSKAHAETMVRYILSLNEIKPKPEKVAFQGKIRTDSFKPADGVYVIAASYTDKGSKEMAALTAKTQLALTSRKRYAFDFDKVYDLKQDSLLRDIPHNAYAGLEHLDLTGIQTISLWAKGNSRVEIYQGSPTGPLLGTIQLNSPDWRLATTPIKNTKGFQDLYFIFLNEKNRFDFSTQVKWVSFD